MDTINFVEFEDTLKHIPEEFRSKFSEVDWSDNYFITNDMLGSDMGEFEISEDLGIFARNEDSTLLRLEDFTAKIGLDTGVILEEEDYELSLTAFFYKGSLKEVIFNSLKSVDRKDRIASQEEFEKKVKDFTSKIAKTADKEGSLIYRVWRSIVTAPLALVRYILAHFIKACWRIQEILT